MKWETIKANCRRRACTYLKNPNSEYSKLRMELFKEGNSVMTFDKLSNKVMDEAEKIIDNWDIRDFNNLRNLFPKEFPKGNLIPIYGENGWELVKN